MRMDTRPRGTTRSDLWLGPLALSCFNWSMGLQPHTYLVTRRIEKAARLLRQGIKVIRRRVRREAKRVWQRQPACNSFPLSKGAGPANLSEPLTATRDGCLIDICRSYWRRIRTCADPEECSPWSCRLRGIGEG